MKCHVRFCDSKPEPRGWPEYASAPKCRNRISTDTLSLCHPERSRSACDDAVEGSMYLSSAPKAQMKDAIERSLYLFSAPKARMKVARHAAQQVPGRRDKSNSPAQGRLNTPVRRVNSLEAVSFYRPGRFATRL